MVVPPREPRGLEALRPRPLSAAGLSRAFDRLAEDLASQRIVWLDGRHLPQGIAFSRAAEKAVELAAGVGR